MRGLRDASRFVKFERKRFCCGDRAEMTSPRATIAGDHEGGGAFAPALPMIWAAGTLANGVELQLVQQSSRLAKGIAGGELEPEPVRKAAP